MGGHHQRVDRPGLLRDTKGGRRQEEVETAGCEFIGGAPKTLRVKGLMIMMNVFLHKWKHLLNYDFYFVFCCIWDAI